MNDDQLMDEHTEIQQLISKINIEHYLGWNTRCITDLKKQYGCGPTNHLLAPGHSAVAEWILKNDTHRCSI